MFCHKIYGALGKTADTNAGKILLVHIHKGLGKKCSNFKGTNLIMPGLNLAPVLIHDKSISV